MSNTDNQNGADAISRMDGEIAVILQKIAAIENDSASHATPGSFWKYTPKARKQMDKLSRDIANLIAEKRALRGSPVACDGYSGRQTNRR